MESSFASFEPTTDLLLKLSLALTSGAAVWAFEQIWNIVIWVKSANIYSFSNNPKAIIGTPPPPNIWSLD